MKKVFFAILMIVAMAFAITPAIAQDSYSSVYGTATQSDAAAVQTPDFKAGNAFGSANDTQSATFGGRYSDPSNDSASGSLTIQGVVSATANVAKGNNTNTSQSTGSANNNGTVLISGVGTPSGVVSNLYGFGAEQTGALAMIGTAKLSGSSVTSGVNGAFALSNTQGSFEYGATSAGPGWIGSGSTEGTSYSQASKITNGFSATSTTTVNSVSCPVNK